MALKRQHYVTERHLKKHKEAGKKNDNYLTSKEYVLMTIACLRKVNSIM